MSKACLGIIPVRVTGSNSRTCDTYALIDDGADKSLCDERLLKRLGQKGRPVDFKITTFSSAGSSVSGSELTLRVQSVAGSDVVELTKVWYVKRLPVNAKSAASAEISRRFPHLADIGIPRVASNDVMLLIGSDTPEAHIPIKVRAGDGHQQFTVRTRLGWAVRGPLPAADNTSDVNIHLASAVTSYCSSNWNDYGHLISAM